METELTIPGLATTGGTMRIVRWLLEEGVTVKRGDELLELETDKAISSVESVKAGVLKRHLVKEGDEVLEGQAYAVIEDTRAAATAKTPAPPPSAPVTRTEEKSIPAAKADVPASAKRVSFFERNRKHKAQPVAVEKVEKVEKTEKLEGAIPLTRIQQITASRLLESKRTIPHFYLQATADAEAMIAARERSGTKIAWDAFFVKAMACAIAEFPRVAYSFAGEALNPPVSDAIGVAMDLTGDLVVVPIEQPAGKEVAEISAEIRYAADMLRAGSKRLKLGPCAATVTNLGVSEVDVFQAIVNPPESVILAVARIAPAVVAREGRMEIRRQVKLSLSADHRVVNGRYAANFLGSVIKHLQSF